MYTEPIIIRCEGEPDATTGTWFDLTNARIYEHPSDAAFLYISETKDDDATITVAPAQAGPILDRLVWLSKVEADRFARYRENEEAKAKNAAVIAGKWPAAADTTGY